MTGRIWNSWQEKLVEQNDRQQLQQIGRALGSATWLAGCSQSEPLYVLKAASVFADNRSVTCLMDMQHNGLPRCLDNVFVETVGCVCHIFEYLHGKPLSGFIGRRVDPGFYEQLAIRLFRLLSFMRRTSDLPLLHLDIKPENILILANHEPALIDFASACVLDPDHLFQPDRYQPDESVRSPTLNRRAAERDGAELQTEAMLSCTTGFAAPELLLGRPHVSSDIYSLAMTLLVCMTGRPPEELKKQSLARAMGDLSAGLGSLLADCLQSDPDLRPSHPDEAAARLEQLEWHSPCTTLSLAPKPAVVRSSIAEESRESDLSAALSPVLCVWQSTEMACELAAYLAGTGKQVLLLDANWIDTRSDLLLGLDNLDKSGMQEMLASHLDEALYAAGREQLNSRRLQELVRQTVVANVDLLAPSGHYETFESDHLDAFCRLLKLARQNYDMIVLSVSSLVYDDLSCLSLMLADQVVAAVAGQSDSIRSSGRVFTFLQLKQAIDMDKVWFAAFDYRVDMDLSKGTLDQLCQQRLIGCVSQSEQRRRCKSGSKPYASCLSRQNRREYHAILLRLFPNSVKSACRK